LGQTNFDTALAPAQRAQAKLVVKDEYTFPPEQGNRRRAGIKQSVPAIRKAKYSLYRPNSS